MEVKAISNNINLLPSRFHKYAYGQDETGIVVDDVVVGDTYAIYGYREFDGEVFYLIERSAPNWLWLMPARLYEPSSNEIKMKLPSTWVEEVHDNTQEPSDMVVAPQLYHDNALEIEDYTKIGQDTVAQIKGLRAPRTIPGKVKKAV